MSQGDIPGAGQAGASPDDGGPGRRVVRRAQRRPGDESAGGIEDAGHGVQGSDGNSIGLLQGRQDRGEPLSEHGLARPRGPHHDEVMSPGGGDLEGLAGLGLPDDVGQVRLLGILRRGRGGIVCGGLGDLLQRGGHGRAQAPSITLDELTDVPDGGDAGAGDELGLGGGLLGDDDLLDPSGHRGLDAGQDTAHRVHGAVQPELADVDGPSQEPGRAPSEPTAGPQDGQGERQVQPGPGLAQVSRGEVDGQALLAPGDAAGAQRGPDALTRLTHGGVGQAHEGESGQALGGMSLDLNDVSGQPGQRHSKRTS